MNQQQTATSTADTHNTDGETRTSKLRVDSEGIVRVTVKQNAEITLTDAKENVEASRRICGGRKVQVLVDMRPLRSMSREARQYMAGESTAEVAKAQALLVDSGFSRIIGNFMLGLNKPPYPTKMFTSEKSALDWLKGHHG
jgi:hypothetical protein